MMLLFCASLPIMSIVIFTGKEGCDLAISNEVAKEIIWWLLKHHHPYSGKSMRQHQKWLLKRFPVSAEDIEDLAVETDAALQRALRIMRQRPPQKRTGGLIIHRDCHCHGCLR